MKLAHMKSPCALQLACAVPCCTTADRGHILACCCVPRGVLLSNRPAARPLEGLIVCQGCGTGLRIALAGPVLAV